jgi:hypothetical protein
VGRQNSNNSRNNTGCRNTNARQQRVTTGDAATRATTHLQDGQVQVDEVEVRLGRRVHLSLQLVEEAHAVLRDALVDVHAHLRDGELDVLTAEVLLRQEPRSDRAQRIIGPRHEPVDRRAVDQRRELAAPHAERVANGRHREHDVQVVADARDEQAVHVVSRVGEALHTRSRERQRRRHIHNSTTPQQQTHVHQVDNDTRTRTCTRTRTHTTPKYTPAQQRPCEGPR